jgi:hypothetical protein
MKRSHMKTTLKCIYFIPALFLLSNIAYADSTSTSTLLGNYQCQRVDPSNNTNAYTLVISDNGGASYSFEWDNAAGFPVLYGVGIMHPSMNNIVNVSFTDPKDANNFGVELFEIKSDGSLQSNWVVQSTNQLGSETCTKSK